MSQNTMPPEPAVITVARATLEDGEVTIDNRLPKHIAIAQGQDLHLHLQYRMAESSREHEDFLISMKSRLGDVSSPEAKHHMRDHLWQSDAEWGFVKQIYEAPEPGEYDLFVDIKASYTKHPWKEGDNKEETLDRAELAQTIPVVIHA